MIWFSFHCDVKECHVGGEICVYTADVYLLLCRLWWLASKTPTACFLLADVCCPVLSRPSFLLVFFLTAFLLALFGLASFFPRPEERKRTRTCALNRRRPNSRIFWLNQQLLRGLVAAKAHKKKTNWITDAREKEIVLVPGRAGQRVEKESCVWEGKKLNRGLRNNTRYRMCFQRPCIKGVRLRVGGGAAAGEL